jgi:hypothetical protein
MPDDIGDRSRRAQDIVRELKQRGIGEHRDLRFLDRRGD